MKFYATCVLTLIYVTHIQTWIKILLCKWW